MTPPPEIPRDADEKWWETWLQARYEQWVDSGIGRGAAIPFIAPALHALLAGPVCHRCDGAGPTTAFHERCLADYVGAHIDIAEMEHMATLRAAEAERDALQEALAAEHEHDQASGTAYCSVCALLTRARGTEAGA